MVFSKQAMCHLLELKQKNINVVVLWGFNSCDFPSQVINAVKKTKKPWWDVAVKVNAGACEKTRCCLQPFQGFHPRPLDYWLRLLWQLSWTRSWLILCKLSKKKEKLCLYIYLSVCVFITQYMLPSNSVGLPVSYCAASSKRQYIRRRQQTQCLVFFPSHVCLVVILLQSIQTNTGQISHQTFWCDFILLP